MADTNNALPLVRLIEQFERLPGIGKKTAQRLAFHVLDMPKEKARAFSEAILEAHEKIRRCPVCLNLTENELCPICSRSDRDRAICCVVENPQDVLAFERTKEYNGQYHVLHGLISPMDGVGPEQLSVKELLARLGSGEIAEVVMATNPTVEGEATAAYLARLLKPLGVKTTRLAYGIPVGGNLEYADEVTLYRALEGRREM
jgi:recombination protein RecR